jgi:DNA-binding IclR family transcriptional regulator
MSRRDTGAPLADLDAADSLAGDAGKDPQFVTALARGLEVLRAFSQGGGLLGNQEIARLTGLPKPTVSRLTYTLTRLGYLEHVERLSKYRPGIGGLALGYNVLQTAGIRRVARPLMQQLADDVHASVSLGQRDRLEAVYIEYCHSNETVTLRQDLGTRVPIATTAMGRAFLAGLPEAERRYLFSHIERKTGAEWPQLKAGIDEALACYERHGFTLSAGDWERTVNAVGVPIIPPDGTGILAFNCGAPAFMLPREKLIDEVGPRLAELARQVTSALARG